MRRRPTRTLAGRLTLMAVLATAATLAVLTATFNLLLERSVDRDVDGRLRARAAAALTTLSVGRGGLRVGEAPDDRAVDDQIWIYAGARALERPAAGRRVQALADRLAGGPARFVDISPQAGRLYAVPIVEHGRRYGTVVAGVSLAGYDRTTDDALVGSAIFAAIVLVIVAGVMRALIASALRPVAEMTSRAAEWSEHDIDQRFGRSRRPAELDQLAGTFDGLLDRLGASLRHEQRLSAELSHELRTPLARVLAEAELLLRRPRSRAEHESAAAVIRDAAQQMTRILDTLMAAARAEADLGHGRADVAAAARQAAAAYAEEAAAQGVEISVALEPPNVHAGVGPEVVEGVLGPLLANACRHAQRSVTVAGRRRDGRVVIDVRDDGGGVAADDVERIFEPGVRGADAGGRGAGLGLPLARRLARAAGGEVSAVAQDGGGAFRVELPAG